MTDQGVVILGIPIPSSSPVFLSIVAVHVAALEPKVPTRRFGNVDTSRAEDVAAGLPSWQPVWAFASESIIVAPAPDAVVTAGELVEIWGWASSFRGIAVVEISVDGGKTYTRAVAPAWLGLAAFLTAMASH